MPNSFAPTLKVSPATSRSAEAHDRVDEVLDGEQLVAVLAVAEDGMRRPSRIQSNRISKTPSRSGPMNVFGRTITTSSPRRPKCAAHRLAVDLRLAVVADADERRVLGERVHLGTP